MLEVRLNAKGLVERLGRGESFGITYRNRTVGELFPPTVSYEISPDDLVYRIAEMAGHLGEVWTPGRSTELFTATLLVARRAGGLLGEFFDLPGGSAASILTPVGMGRFREACGSCSNIAGTHPRT